MVEVAQNTKNKPTDKLAASIEGERFTSLSVPSSLFKRLNDGVLYCRAIFNESGKPTDYIVVGVNQAFRRIMQLHSKQVLGQKVSELMTAPYTPRYWKEKCDKTTLTNRSFTVEANYPATGKWLSVYGFCPKDGYLAITVKDITARKKTEQALKQSEKKYKQLANSIADPFFALDSSLKIVYWNKASEKLTKTTAKTVLGKQIFDAFGKDKVIMKIVKRYLNVMRTNKPKTFIGELPKCNGDKVFEIQVYPTGNGVSVFAKDITERRKIQTSLEAYTKQLENLVKERTERLKGAERLAAIGETAGMVGHDIRNPLQTIIGELYLAKCEAEELPPSKQKTNLATSLAEIEYQTIYINKIVSDLQEFAKSRMPIFEELDLEQTIDEILASIEIPLNVVVSRCVHKPLSDFKSDVSFLKRILTNLIRNGVQAMSENGGNLTVNAFRQVKSVIISVSDTGVGIPIEARDKIFKPLFTTKSKGQGFGLAVVKKLVETLGGQVSFESKIGYGTTFILELPLVDEVNPG